MSRRIYRERRDLTATCPWCRTEAGMYLQEDGRDLTWICTGRFKPTADETEGPKCPGRVRADLADVEAAIGRRDAR